MRELIYSSQSDDIERYTGILSKCSAGIAYPIDERLTRQGDDEIPRITWHHTQISEIRRIAVNTEDRGCSRIRACSQNISCRRNDISGDRLDLDIIDRDGIIQIRSRNKERSRNGRFGNHKRTRFYIPCTELTRDVSAARIELPIIRSRQDQRTGTLIKVGRRPFIEDDI